MPLSGSVLGYPGAVGLLGFAVAVAVVVVIVVMAAMAAVVVPRAGWRFVLGLCGGR